MLTKCLLNAQRTLLKHFPELFRSRHLFLKGSSDHNIYLRYKAPEVTRTLRRPWGPGPTPRPPLCPRVHQAAPVFLPRSKSLPGTCEHLFHLCFSVKSLPTYKVLPKWLYLHENCQHVEVGV